MLFISYSTKDREVASELYARLTDRGYHLPFLDYHPDSGIPGGSKWEDELRWQLKVASGLVVLCSKNWEESKWCFAELDRAKEFRKAVIPLNLDHSIPVATISRYQSIPFHKRDEDAYGRLWRALETQRLTPGGDFYWPRNECPFPGLASFQEEHAGVFFGRAQELSDFFDHYLNHMRQTGKSRLIYVIGPSGSGKSSFVRAGVLPRLKFKSRGEWQILTIFRWAELKRDGQRWQERLAQDIERLYGGHPDAPRWNAKERSGRYSANESTQSIEEAALKFVLDVKDLLAALDRTQSTPVIVLDQFEELLVTDTADERIHFLRFIRHAVSADDSPCRVIATVRSDFLPHIQEHPQLIPWNEQTRIFRLDLLKRERLFDVVRGPAEMVDIRFENDALINRIVDEAQSSDALPLLAFALKRFYDSCADDRVLTIEEYETKLGGIDQCLNSVSQGVLKDETRPEGNVDSIAMEALRVGFVRELVRYEEAGDQKEGRFVRRTAKWADLPPESHNLLEKMSSEEFRLVSIDRRENALTTVEVTHEALFRQWKTLKTWLDQRRDLLRWRTDVRRSLDASGGKWSGLSRSQLAIARDWPKQRPGELTAEELKLIRNGIRRQRFIKVGISCITVLFAIISLIAILSLNETKKQIVANQKTIDRLQQSEASSLFRPFDNKPDVTAEEARAIWDIVGHQSDTDHRVMRYFVREATRSEANLARLSAQQGYIIRAWVGLDASRRKAFIDEVPWSGLPSGDTPETLAALNRLAINLEPGPDEAKRLADVIWNKIKGNPDPHDIERCLYSFQWCGRFMDSLRAGEVVDYLIKNIESDKTGNATFQVANLTAISSISPALGKEQSAEKAARIAAVVGTQDEYRLYFSFDYLADLGLIFSNIQIETICANLNKLSDTHVNSFSETKFIKGLGRILSCINNSDVIERLILSKTKFDDVFEQYIVRYVELGRGGPGASRVAEHLVKMIPGAKQDPKVLLPLVPILTLEARTELAAEIFRCYQELGDDKWTNAPQFAEVILKLDSPGFEKRLADALLSQLETSPPTTYDSVRAALVTLLPTLPDSKFAVLADVTKKIEGVTFGSLMSQMPELLKNGKPFLVAKLLVADSPQSISLAFYPVLKRLTNEQATELARMIVLQFEVGLKDGAIELANALEILSPMIVEEERQALANRCVALLEGSATRLDHVNRAITHLFLSNSLINNRVLKKYERLLQDETKTYPDKWSNMIDDIAAIGPPRDSEAAQFARAKAIPLLGQYSFEVERRVATLKKLDPTQAEIREACNSILVAMRKDDYASDDLTYTNAIVAIGASPEQLVACHDLVWVRFKNKSPSNPERTIAAISLIGRSRLAEALEIALDYGLETGGGAFDAFPKLESFVLLLGEQEQLRLAVVLGRGLASAKSEDSAKRLVGFLDKLDKIPLQNLMDFLKLPAVSGNNENPVLDAVEQILATKWTSTIGEQPKFDHSSWKMTKWMEKNKAFLRDHFQLQDLDEWRATPPLSLF